MRAEWGCLSECYRAPQKGNTPLHDAAVKGHVAVVEWLLAMQAVMEAKNEVRGGRGVQGRGHGGVEGQHAAFRVILFAFL